MASLQPSHHTIGKNGIHMPIVSTVRPKREKTIAKRRIVQNFVLIWLDAHINESNSDFHESMTQLRAMVDAIDIFTDPDRCLNFMTRIKDEKIFLMVSGALGEHFVPRIHQMSEVDSIFVFCGNKSKHEQWAKKLPKIVGVFIKIKHICQALKQVAYQCDQNSIGISCIPTGSNASDLASNQVDPSFMYTQLLKEALLDIQYDPQAIRDLTSFCRKLYADNPQELRNTTKFEKEYELKTPIWWYTYECFLYKTLNRALRNLEVDILLKMGFFIRDLHRQITESHAQRATDPFMKQTFIVYRGQALVEADFEKLKQMPGGLMSFNNFLSTSKDEEKSLEFAMGSALKTGMVGVIFKIQVDPTIPSAPYVSVKKWSAIPSENEILFSTHTVFRIGEIERQEQSNNLYQIKLMLTRDDEQQLSLLTNQLREEIFAGLNGWHRLAPLLLKMGEYDQAESLYKLFLEQKPSELERSLIYHMLGILKSEQGELTVALEFFEKSLEIRKKIFPPNNIVLGYSYNNIGLTYFSQGEFAKALVSHEKALEINQNWRPTDYHVLGMSHLNIGLVYESLREFPKALLSYEKTLDIWSKLLAPNHFDIAKCYNRIAAVYLEMSDYDKAFQFQQKAFQISKSTLPSNHPAMASAYNDMGFVYESMGKFAEALAHYEKSLKIREKILPSHDMYLGHSYNSLGIVYEKIGELSKALPLYQKALQILEKNLPGDHLHLGEAYNNIGTVYERMNQNPEALRWYEKAISIFQQKLPPGHPLSGTFYATIGRLHHQMGNYTKALSFYEKVLEIRKSMKPINQFDLAQVYHNIGLLHETMGNHRQALPFYENALGLLKQTALPTSLDLAEMHETMGRIHERIGEYKKAVMHWQSSIDIAQRSLPPAHPHIRTLKSCIEQAKKRSFGVG